MASTLRYKCNNDGCDFRAVLHVGVPEFWEGVPGEERKLPVRKGYVAYYIDEEYCRYCRSTYEITHHDSSHAEDSVPVWRTIKDLFSRGKRRESQPLSQCPTCKRDSTALKEGAPCPVCADGHVVLGPVTRF